jgi:hypothetical protein
MTVIMVQSAGLLLPTLHPSATWDVTYRDVKDLVYLYNFKTGCTRAGPWIALRAVNSEVYYVNLLTRDTRWLPPSRWMEDWYSRDPDAQEITSEWLPRFDHRSREGQRRFPVAKARAMVEGGAPYLCPPGVYPQYARLASDTPDTYPD